MSEKPSIQVFVTPAGLGEIETEGHLCLVVDTLRACTTVAYALDAGAKGIIPVETVEEATRLAGTLDRETTLLCGERGGIRIEGFHLGNSPSEYTDQTVAGKTLVLSTSNGARVLAALSEARGCIAAAFVTMRACARRAREESRIVIVCAGAGPRFSLEDFLCAGMLVNEITRDALAGYTLDDGARTALQFYRSNRRKIPRVVEDTDHGQSLRALGFARDLELACEVNRFDFVPVLRDGKLVAEELPVERPVEGA